MPSLHKQDRNGPLSSHVPLKATMDAISGVLDIADTEARERMSSWLGHTEARSWEELEEEVITLRARVVVVAGSVDTINM